MFEDDYVIVGSTFCGDRRDIFMAAYSRTMNFIVKFEDLLKENVHKIAEKKLQVSQKL